jgi:hypothetical protein
MLFTGDKQTQNHYKTMAENKKWIVTTSGKRPIDEVVRDLKSAGFSVDQVLTEIGCVTGSADNDAVQKIRSIPGIQDISPESGIDIGPPDSDITW